ncbi:MAG: group 1 truncated hemoglobin [Gammaproteobacteria bacterium]|nr:group 1 truncated hemoglobin [Gammaproteobacteria bacterium]
MKKNSLFEQVGGLATLEKVHKEFYDKIYAHPWLGLFFEGHDQTAIEGRQTSFMAEKFGGPKTYMGKPPKSSHRALYITDELFDLRQAILDETLAEVGLNKELRAKWLRIDEAFRSHIVKKSIADFYHTTWHYEQRVIHPKPSE